MNQVPVQELSQNECQSALSGYGYNAQSSTCCRAKGTDACLADVGSALACRTPGGQYVLRGMYSTETECSNPNQLVTFAKMDTAWIRQSLKSPQRGNIQQQQQQFHQGGSHNLANGHVTGQASHTINTVYRSEITAQPSANQVYSVPSQAPLYLPPNL